MKKLIVICIVCACLLTPLKGYTEYVDIYANQRKLWAKEANLEKKIKAADKSRKQVLITVGFGILVIAGTYIWSKCHSDFKKAQDNEADLLKNAWDFRCSNTQLYQGQYQRYLSEIESFLTKCPRNKKFRNDMKTVFEMSQKDSRLTPKEKQEIANEFTSKYKFILPEGQAK